MRAPLRRRDPGRAGRAALACLAAATLAGAAPSPHPPVEAARTGAEIRIDGVLDEPAWEAGLVIDDFLQQLPLEAAPPSERTVVRLLYDETTLYLGFRCYDRDPARIRVGTLLRDSFRSQSGETVAWAIDSTDSGRDGYWFSSNPGGAESDSQVINEGEVFRVEWDAIWDAAGRIDAEGWTLEVRLPFYNLQFRKGATNVMRINFFRAIRHENEEIYAPYIPRNYPQGTMSFSIGRPVIFRDIRPGRAVQLKPFGVGAATEIAGEDQAAGTEGDTDATGDVGVDVKWTVTPDWVADFTVNPDFAQAEADEVQINLTRFPLFFPEKREFFLENAGLFDFGVPGSLQAFFSRRIGLDAQARPVPLLGGARLTGRTGPWSVGVLDAVADETPDERRTNFFVSRLRRDLLRRSSAGAIVTDRRESGGPASRLGGADALFRFREDHSVSAFAMGSRNEGDETRWAASAAYGKVGDRWRWAAGARLVDDGFDPAVGFVRRPGIQQGNGFLEFRPRPAKLPAVRQFEFAASLFYLEARTDDPILDGSVLERSAGLSQDTKFETGDEIGVSYDQTFERLTEDFEIVEGVIIPAGDYHNDGAVVSFQTYDGRRWSGAGFVTRGSFFDGRRTVYGANVTGRFNRHVTWASSYTHNRARLPYGDFDTNLWIQRLDYAFTARLFGTLLAQWNDVTDEVDLNFRLRWRHHPGSDLYVIYNQTRSTDPEPGEPRTPFRQGIVKLTWAILF